MEPVILLLTANGPAHCYVANRLASACSLAAIVVDRGKPKALLKRMRYLCRKYSVGQLISLGIVRLVSRIHRDNKQRQKEMFRILGRENCETHLHKDLITYVAGINSKQSFQAITRFKPDYLLVYGTSMVSDRILELAQKGALNMHTGISPYYRGTECEFWPLYNEELDMLGATIHECTSVVDGGAIYEVGHASLDASDRLFSVFARCVKVGADLYVKTVHDILSDTLVGKKQHLGLGRQYRNAMKTWRHERIVRRKIQQGLIRNYVQGQSAAKC